MQLISKKNMDSINKDEAEHRKCRFQLAKLLRSTEEMLICAQNGDWESVEEMEISRKEKLAACFIENSNEDSEVIVEALAALIHLNKQILELVQAAKSEMINERGQFENNKSAVYNYHLSQSVSE